MHDHMCLGVSKREGENLERKPAILTRLNWGCIPNNRLLLKVANWNVGNDTRWYWIESEVVQSSFKKFTQSSSLSSASVNFYLSIYLPPIDQSVITARLKICRRWEIPKDNRRIIRFESCGLEVFWSTGWGEFCLEYSNWIIRFGSIRFESLGVDTTRWRYSWMRWKIAFWLILITCFVNVLGQKANTIATNFFVHWFFGQKKLFS